MGKRPEAASAAAVASEQDTLLATKLYLPQPPPGFVARRRLLDLLDEGTVRGLMLVCAPAGFGKTALLADWIRRGQRPAAWLSVDRGDSDPARFWRHVAAALDQVCSGIASWVDQLLRLPAISFESLVTVLINELTDAHVDAVLVLDDFHLIDSRPVHESVQLLIEHQPQGLCVVLASRADPPLPLARFRARAQLAELRVAQLRFTSDEAAALLAAAVGRDVPPDVVAAWATRTEGWAAGLQLAALSLRGKPDAARFVASFSGSQRYVLDYLAEEVLDRQPNERRAFLLQTSVLDRLSGPLCDAVTGGTDGQAMLEAIEADGLFLIPLDEVRGYWRYHQLFADLLRVRLRQEQPDLIPGLHRAEAIWYEADGLIDDAINHAVAAGDTAWAAQLIERHFDVVAHRAEGATVERWVASLPAELVRSRPRLSLVRAIWAHLWGRPDEVEPLLGDAERALARSVDEPYEPSAGRKASLVANVPAAIALTRAAFARRRGDVEYMEVCVHTALSELTEDDEALRAFVIWYQAVVDCMHGRVVEARPALASLVPVQRAAAERGDRYLTVRPAYDLGQVEQKLGRLEAALRAYREAVELASEAGRPLPLAGEPHIGIADVLYERGELAAALRHATEGIKLCRQLAFTSQPVANGLATFARIRQAAGDPAGAWAAIGEAERVALASPRVASLLNPVPAERARLMLADDQTPKAARWAAERGLAAEDEPKYAQERDYLVLARLLLTEDQPDRALLLLERLLTVETGQSRIGTVIEVRVLQALSLAARGDNARALDALSEALRLGYSEDYQRVFVDEGAPMRDLLGKLVATRRDDLTVPGEYPLRLLDAFGEPDVTIRRRPAVPQPGLPEPLTAREVDVLGLLAAGKSNQRIAEELVITLDTVKKHVSHVLDKLGAANRTEAVVRGRQLGLIS